MAEEKKVTRYPLDWPAHKPRAKHRQRAKFNSGGAPVEFLEGIRRVKAELQTMRARDVVISLDVEMRTDSAPYSRNRATYDVGAVVYFKLDAKPYAFPCDKWDRLGDNLAAIAHHIRAVRGMERWGVGSLEQAFTGFLALPAKGETGGEAWYETLGVKHDAAATEIKKAYRDLALRHHPDKGGSPVTWHKIAEAYRCAEVSGLVS